MFLYALRILATLLLFIVIGCSGQEDLMLGPSQTVSSPVNSDSGPTQSPTPVPESTSGIVVSGPRGCIDAKDLLPVVRWEISNFPTGAKFTKGYAWDDTPAPLDADGRCLPVPTTQNLRTENDHLRVKTDGSNTLNVEFDRDTVTCRGRIQVDVSIDGQPELTLVINRPDGENCTPPPPPPCQTCECNPKFCPPPPPPCEADNKPSFEVETFRTEHLIGAESPVKNNGYWQLFLLSASLLSEYENSTPDFTKAIDEETLKCLGSATLRVSYNWREHPSKYWWIVLKRNGMVVYKSASPFVKAE